MLPEKIMQSDLLDILFENRNKTYGAYALRRSYGKTLVSAITITCFIALAFSLMQLLRHPKESMITRPFIIPQDNELSEIKMPDEQPLIKPVASKPPATQVKQEVLSAPVITKDILETDMPTVDALDKAVIAAVRTEGEDATGIVEPPVNNDPGTGNTKIETVETVTDNKPLSYAEVMPEYPGGIEALKKFMLRHLKQPDDLEPGEKIIVSASFIVNKNGKIEQVKITNSGRFDLNKEVERVINKMPLWKPGMQNGSAVAVYFKLPVTFMGEAE